MDSLPYLSSKYCWLNCWARFRESLIDLLLKVESQAICVFAQQIQENQPEKIRKLYTALLDGKIASPVFVIEYFQENFYVKCFHFMFF